MNTETTKPVRRRGRPRKVQKQTTPGPFSVIIESVDDYTEGLFSTEEDAKECKEMLEKWASALPTTIIRIMKEV